MAQWQRLALGAVGMVALISAVWFGFGWVLDRLGARTDSPGGGSDVG